MSRRLDIEITSLSDERFTWRVSGAKQPKGEAAASLLPEGTKIGDELKADADFTIDGIDVLAIATPSERKEPQRLELIAKDPTDLVTTKLAAKGGGGRHDRDEAAGADAVTKRRSGRQARAGATARAAAGRGDRPHRPAPPEVPTRPKAKRLRAARRITTVLARSPRRAATRRRPAGRRWPPCRSHCIGIVCFVRFL